MRIRPLASEAKLSRRLFEQLAEQIKSGRLAPGSRLPTEHALTRAARVSRTVVREAVAASLLLAVGVWANNTQLRADPSEASMQVLAHRGLHQTFDLAGLQNDTAVAKFNDHFAAPDEEQFVFVLVMMPGEDAGEFHELEFLAVELGDNFGAPVLMNQGELFG